MLAPLPLSAWQPTKTTLHAMCQIVGKIRLGHVPHRAHWWNLTLHPTARGLSTLRMRSGTTFFEIEFDFIDHRVIVRANTLREPMTIALRDGLSVASFYAALFEALRACGIDTAIVDKPYMMASTIPFSRDEEHASYDAAMVRRWWDALVWSADVFERYAVNFAGKASPAHLFWHGFDLALARFSGRRAAGPPKDDPVQEEAYSHEVIAVGFWPGDDKSPFPAYYTYTAPEPAELATYPLAPEGAAWFPSGNGHLGILPYDAVRESENPEAALLTFAKSGFAAGVDRAGWDLGALASRFADTHYRADADGRLAF